jgi:ABC-type lipoprotein release transport system permease subunit
MVRPVGHIVGVIVGVNVRLNINNIGIVINPKYKTFTPLLLYFYMIRYVSIGIFGYI